MEFIRFLSVIRAEPNGRILIPKDIREFYNLESTIVGLSYKNQGIYMREDAQKTTAEFIRRINDQGRLSIPPSIRKQLDWENQNYVELFLHVRSNCFFLQGDHRSCVLCSNTDVNKMVPINGKYVCEDCLQVALGNRFMLQAYNRNEN